MSESLRDPLQDHFDIHEESIKSEEFLSSIPLADRVVHHDAWRRIIEQPTNLDEFSECLTALNTLRSFGIDTPPYSAVIDTYRDGREQFTLQVGHVEGLLLDELDVSGPIRDDYIELGSKLLTYFDFCNENKQPHLTDIARGDQYIYGRNSTMAIPKPILVDLELHTGHGNVVYQLAMFYKSFLMDLEEKSGSTIQPLRAQLRAIVKSIEKEVPEYDSYSLLALRRALF